MFLGLAHPGLGIYYGRVINGATKVSEMLSRLSIHSVFARATGTRSIEIEWSKQYMFEAQVESRYSN